MGTFQLIVASTSVETNCRLLHTSTVLNCGRLRLTKSGLGSIATVVTVAYALVTTYRCLLARLSVQTDELVLPTDFHLEFTVMSSEALRTVTILQQPTLSWPLSL